MMVKYLLDSRAGESRCKNNFPGDDWYKSFIKRNRMSARMASNIKHSRSKVDTEMVSTFFNEVEMAFEEADGVENVNPANIFNYDETNFVNNLGKSSVIVRRGRKRVEKVQEISKQAFSVMWCGSATGELLPPMVVYKAKNVCTGWVEGGPRNAVYDSSVSGWFDSYTFKRWFIDVLLPAVEDREGKKFLFGDNLSSHFSPELVEIAKEKQVIFIMLLPNETNWMQILDVAVFGPMKRSWWTILKHWRMESKQIGDIPKTVFPSLLRQLDLAVHNTVKENLISGFRTCSIWPLNSNSVLDRLPEKQADNSSPEETNISLNETLIELLKENRGHSKGQKESRGKKVPKKVLGLNEIIAGRVLEHEEEESGGVEEVVAGEGGEEIDEECNESGVDASMYEQGKCSTTVSCAVDECDDVCALCRKSDDLFSDDEEDVDWTIDWISC